MPPDAIETARLVMTRPCVADYDDMLAMWAEPAVTRFIGGRPATPEEVWRRLLGYAGLWSLLGYGFWVVREKTTGRFVGEVGFADFHRHLTPVLDERPEVGWVLSSVAHGQGFASEAVAAVLQWGREAWGPREVACIIADGNTASFRVAERMGFAAVGTEDYRGVPMTVLVCAL